jgi:hypothetical protein
MPERTEELQTCGVCGEEYDDAEWPCEICDEFQMHRESPYDPASPDLECRWKGPAYLAPITYLIACTPEGETWLRDHIDAADPGWLSEYFVVGEYTYMKDIAIAAMHHGLAVTVKALIEPDTTDTGQESLEEWGQRVEALIKETRRSHRAM